MTCPNANVGDRGSRGNYYVQKWIAVYLADALARIQALLDGYTLKIEDVYAMQFTCAYEVGPFHFLNVTHND